MSHPTICIQRKTILVDEAAINDISRVQYPSNITFETKIIDLSLKKVAWTLDLEGEEGTMKWTSFKGTKRTPFLVKA